MTKQILKYGLSLAIAGVFFWLAFKDFTAQDLEELWRMILNANYLWLLFTMVLMVVSHLVRAWRWGVLLSTVKEKMRLTNLFNATMIGYAVNMVLPRVGEVTKSVNLARQEKIDAKKVLASVVVERMLDTLMFALLLAISAFVFRVKVNSVFGEVKLWGVMVSFEIAAYLILLVSLLLLGMFAVLSLYPEAAAKIAENWLEKYSKKWAERISNALKAFVEGTASLKNRTKYAEIVLSSLCIWGLYLLGMLFPFYALSLHERYQLGVLEALTTLSISGFGQLITPAGAGTYQYACQITLEKLFDVARVEASGFALITFALQTLTNAGFGVIAFLVQVKSEASESAQSMVASEKVAS